MEKTPELKEMHTDGGYGSEANDKKFEELGITQVTTAVRGRECEVEIIIAQTSQSPAGYLVKCPGQQVVSTPTKQRHKVRCYQEAIKEYEFFWNSILAKPFQWKYTGEYIGQMGSSSNLMQGK